MGQDVASKRQERVAWAIIWLAFALFCVLAVSLPLAVQWYIRVAAQERPVTLEIIRGTVLFVRAGTHQEVNASNRMAIAEGDQVRAAADSQALLILADGSNIRLWPGSTVRVVRSRSSRWNDSYTDVILVQNGGRSRVEVALPATEARLFEVRTPQSAIRLRDGSYGLDVDNEAVEISVRNGSASVTGTNRTLELLAGERTVVRDGEPPTLPMPATVNLVENGDFGRGLEGWQSGNRNVEDDVLGAVSLLFQDRRNIVQFLRQGSRQHAQTFIHQAIDRDVSDYQLLRLHLEMKIVSQSLSGGGWLGSEYPLMIRLRYRDANNNEATWTRGFFIHNLEGMPTTGGEQVRDNIWLPFAIDLFDHHEVNPHPSHILWLEIEASGWEYESQVTNIRLKAE